MTKKKQPGGGPQKLELTWIGKGEEPKLEPRILIENPEYSYGDSHSENMLIHGDNLLALKALEQEYAGKVKCIFIECITYWGHFKLPFDTIGVVRW